MVIIQHALHKKDTKILAMAMKYTYVYVCKYVANTIKSTCKTAVKKINMTIRALHCTFLDNSGCEINFETSPALLLAACPR